MRFDFHWGVLAGQPVARAAPWPVFGLLNQTFCDRVLMDVAEFLCDLRLSQDIEIVITSLPELWAIFFESLRCLVFEDVESGRERMELRFGE